MSGKKVYELILEIGHRSSPISKKLANGYTHKWTVFVRGINSSKIEHCIQRVVFQLHESFDKPYQDISEPPYQIKETGYAGFEIPIQIHFKNRDRPNRIDHVHDLCLLTNKPNDTTSLKKVKFINPNKEFEKCLIKAGAQLLGSVKKERNESPPAKKHKSSSVIPSKDMNKQAQAPAHTLAQDQSQPNDNQHQKPSKQFIDTFGAPLVYTKSQSNNNSVNTFRTIQTKIQNLSDGDRLQKIVDIIEEAGEWFRLTPKMLEFDLKRLDRKTLSKIESCLM